MTAYARVITLGRNDTMPRTYTLPVGVGVDGSVFTHRITLRPDEILCPECNGQGEIECGSNDPSVRDWTERCGHCRGHGIIEIENPDAAGCLPASGPGRPELNDCTVSGRPSSSGVQPVARAAGDLPCFTGRTAHTVKRSVPGPSASRRPAPECPHTVQGTLADKIIDAVTVIAGLSIFGVIAMFLMVLS